MIITTVGITSGQTTSGNIEPKIDINVNKEYDDNGNVIRYDSSYVKTYSYNGTLSEDEIDSVFQQFGFGSHMGLSMNSFSMDDQFFSDEAFGNDLMFNESFLKTIENRMQEMNNYFRQMDSVFYNQPLMPEVQPNQQQNAEPRILQEKESIQDDKKPPTKPRQMI